MVSETVTSAQNPKIKELLALQEKSRERRGKSLFVVEGKREFGHCMEAGFIPETIFVCGEILGSAEKKVVSEAVSANPDCRIVEVPASLYSKLAFREGTEGIVAEIRSKERSLESLELPENPLIVVLESVEKPGNLGAVLRSADAAGADAVIVCDPLTDLFNPNLIRASIGAVFTVPTVACTSAEAIKFLKDKGISILTAQLQDSSPYYDVDMKKGIAIVMGTESTGLSPVWRMSADAHIMIPMLGKLDSLNVSVSAAILLYEAVRQRQS
jgi:TrmH family RNA methyltransferase